jgi:putative hemolysin
MGRYLWEILLILGFILLQGYFAAAEIALISARKAMLRSRAEEGSAGAAAALRLTSDPTRLLATIQIGVTLLSLGASAVAAVSLGFALEGWLKRFPVLAGVAAGLSVLLVTLAVSYLTLVLGELTPKRIGLRYAERVASSVSRPIAALSLAAAPVVWLLSASSGAVARLLGVQEGGRPGVTEEEIKLLVTEQGTLLDEEKRMIHEIFELGDTVVREIMVPRVDVVMLADDASLGDALAVFKRTGYSRLPVYNEDPDRVTGILLLKDIVIGAAPGAMETQRAGELMRPPYFVPESKQILGLLTEMRATRNHMAVVVDEYGGTAGIATIEDIVEEVVGEIADEFDRDRQYVRTLSPTEYVVDGRLPIEDAREMLGVDIEDSEDYDTIAGWVLAELGHIPSSGESTMTEDGSRIRVATVRRRRIVMLTVTKPSAGDEGPVRSVDEQGET